LIEVLELGVTDTVKLLTESKLSSYLRTCPGNSLSELGFHFAGTSSLKPSKDFNTKPVSTLGVPKILAGHQKNRTAAAEPKKLVEEKEKEKDITASLFRLAFYRKGNE
jgi:hypothetical protein